MNNFSPDAELYSNNNTAPENAVSKNDFTPKKEFVEPELSAPVDVLEATEFFQGFGSTGTI